MTRNPHSKYRCSFCLEEVYSYKLLSGVSWWIGIVSCAWCYRCDCFVILLETEDRKFVGSQSWINDPFTNDRETWIAPFKARDDQERPS